MKLAVPKETAPGETRVAATPESIKKFKGLGVDVTVETGAGGPARIADADYAAAGATIAPDARSALADADVVILQPGYVCQGACRAVGSHCAQSGVRCVQLDKPCVLGFAHSLAQAIAAS